MIAFAALLLLAAGADPGPEELAPVRITVRAIAASKSAADVDARLAPIAHDLANFGNDFRFQSYRLVAGQSFDLGWNGSAEMELPGSRSVRLTPKHMGPDGRVKVHLELFGEHFLDSMPVLAWPVWMAGVALLTVGWLVAARDVWRLARLP